MVLMLHVLSAGRLEDILSEASCCSTSAGLGRTEMEIDGHVDDDLFAE